MTRYCLVVEDEDALGEMIADNLGLEGYGVERMQDGAQALERLRRGGIDLVILDVMLPGLDGFEILRAMRASGDTTPVLILSARSSDKDRIKGLELQADDYLTKPFHLKELLLRVKALLRRNKALPVGEDVLRFAGNEVDFRAQRATSCRSEAIELTASEAKLLRLLAQRPGEVVSRREIVEAVFGPTTPMTHRTLDNLVLSLRKSFEPDPKNPTLFHTVRGVGLRFTPGD